MKDQPTPATTPTLHPERGDLDKMIKKPASIQRELAEARRILSRVIVPPAKDNANEK